MKTPENLIESIFEGWKTYQEFLIEAISPLDRDQLALCASSKVRTVGNNAQHMIGARARWFYKLMGEGGEAFASLGTWDRRGSPTRSVAELVDGFEVTWRGMHTAISQWDEATWQQTWPGNPSYGPKVLTRQWVIWHLIEHDLHHGGEISITLGMHGIQALSL
jgi:uncharacterized damage-inducible protein DinB